MSNPSEPQSISNNAHHGDTTRNDGYNRAKCTRSPWIHRREKRQTTRRNSRRIDRQPAFPIVSPSPRGFVLPRFVNAGRHLLAATVTPRPASKNLQESGLSLRPQTKMIHLKKADSRGCDATFFGYRPGEGLVRAYAQGQARYTGALLNKPQNMAVTL
jgi:hypothetical protein